MRLKLRGKTGVAQPAVPVVFVAVVLTVANIVAAAGAVAGAAGAEQRKRSNLQAVQEKPSAAGDLQMLGGSATMVMLLAGYWTVQPPPTLRQCSVVPTRLFAA